MRHVALRPYSRALVRGLRETFTGEWERQRVQRLVREARGRSWSLVDAERALEQISAPAEARDVARDLLLHAYLQGWINALAREGGAQQGDV
jgi:hypothetical protein